MVTDVSIVFFLARGAATFLKLPWTLNHMELIL